MDWASVSIGREVDGTWEYSPFLKLKLRVKGELEEATIYFIEALSTNEFNGQISRSRINIFDCIWGCDWVGLFFCVFFSLSHKVEGTFCLASRVRTQAHFLHYRVFFLKWKYRWSFWVYQKGNWSILRSNSSFFLFFH